MPKKTNRATQLKERAESARRAKVTKSRINATGEEQSKELEAEQAQVEQQSNAVLLSRKEEATIPTNDSNDKFDVDEVH